MRTGLLLLLASLLVYNVNLREISSQDTLPTRLLPVAIIERHTTNLDHFFRDYPRDAPLPYWIQEVRGHYVSSTPILPALLAVPVYFVPILLFGGESFALINLLAKVSATLFAALSVFYVYLALVYAFGTSTWSTASQGLWGHGPAQLFMAVAIYCALRGDEDGRFFDWVGVTTGLMVAGRQGTVFIAGALVLYVLHRDRRRGVRCLLLFVAALLPFVLYNLWTFQSVQGGYARLFATDPSFAGAWTTPLREGFLGLLLSPNRGLFVYSPIMVFAVGGVVLSRWEQRRLFFGYLAGGFGASLLMLSKYSWWFGGECFGPRSLTDFLPALIMFLMPVWKRLDGAALVKVAWSFLFAASVFVQLIGVFYYPSARQVDWNKTPTGVPFSERLWDWRDTQIVRLIRNGPHPLGFGSLN